MAEEVSDVEQYERFCKGILHLWGIGLSSYGQRQLHRRLRFMMERSGDADLDAFLQHLTEDCELSAKLKDQFTINVSEFSAMRTCLRASRPCCGLVVSVMAPEGSGVPAVHTEPSPTVWSCY